MTKRTNTREEDEALGLNLAFNVAYLDGSMESEHPEIRERVNPHRQESER